MILSYLARGYTLGDILPILLLSIPIILISLTVHECSHGYVSHLLGDDTAKNTGRLSLNPLAHLEPFGALCMLLFGFGWAKPVPINPRYYKHKRLDVALTALAGPFSNLILSFFAVLGMHLLNHFYRVPDTYGFSFSLVYALFLFLELSVYMNVGLAVFNLLPIPPLDGSRVLFSVLPNKLYFKYLKYERYIYYGLLAVILIGNVTGYNIISIPISFLSTHIISFMESAVRFILGF